MGIEEELKPSAGDFGHKIIKTGLGCAPGVGGILSEVFSTVFTDPSVKRRDKILIEIYKRLEKLELNSKYNNNIQKLQESEVFLTIVFQAYQVAMRTHQKEKIRALMNCIEHSALDDVDENLQHMFLMFIDSFTEWHLRVLLLLDNPEEVLCENGIDKNSCNENLAQVFYAAYPQLKEKREFSNQVIRDLYGKGLITTDGSVLGLPMAPPDGLFSSRTTGMGKEFLKFISDIN